MCKDYSSNITKDIFNHLKNAHDIIIESEELTFASVGEFYDWKSKIETEHSTQFKKRTTKSSKLHVLTKYVCSRSGMFNPSGHGKRHVKLQGSKKINAFCPSAIDLTVNTDGMLITFDFVNNQIDISFVAGFCTVKFIKKHVGHKPELTHMTLNKEEKSQLAKKIAQKIPFNVILDEIRGSVENSNLKRVHLTNKKDLFNIEHCYQLAHPPTWHENDAISVETWINSVKDEGCVLFYKPQGSLHPPFKNEDFILIIMTSSQTEILKDFGSDIICVDGTHGTNCYDFELHTVLVVDELREGFPCAFLISNRSDQEVFSLFFSEIQKQVGLIKCNTFMSDMADAYFNAWIQIMGQPNHR